MKSKQKTLIDFFKLLDKFNAEQKTQIGFLDLLDEISAKAWLKWAKDEEKKRKIRTRTSRPRRKVREKGKGRVSSPLDLVVQVPNGKRRGMLRETSPQVSS